MQWTGPEGLFSYLAAVLAIIAAFTVYRMMRRRAMPPEQQGNFLPIEPQTSGAPGLDPRSGEATAPSRGA